VRRDGFDKGETDSASSRRHKQRPKGTRAPALVACPGQGCAQVVNVWTSLICLMPSVTMVANQQYCADRQAHLHPCIAPPS
jgi:hypothetical protein